MGANQELFCFIIDNQRYALHLQAVDRILQAVAVNQVPNAPPVIYGLIDYYGTLLPVMNLRFRLRLPERSIRASDYFIIANTPKRKLALVIDEPVDVVVTDSREIISASAMDPGLSAKGFVRCDDGIIFIYDLETFFTARDEDLIREIIENKME